MRIGVMTFTACALLLGLESAVHAQVSFGIRIGQPPPPRVYRVPRQPGPEFVWVEGYWYPEGRQYAWHDGYWTRPPYEDAYWIEPYYVRGQYVAGYWQTPHGRFEHDHRWDRESDRRDRREERREEQREERHEESRGRR